MLTWKGAAGEDLWVCEVTPGWSLGKGFPQGRTPAPGAVPSWGGGCFVPTALRAGAGQGWGAELRQEVGFGAD